MEIYTSRSYITCNSIENGMFLWFTLDFFLKFTTYEKFISVHLPMCSGHWYLLLHNSFPKGEIWTFQKPTGINVDWWNSKICCCGHHVAIYSSQNQIRGMLSVLQYKPVQQFMWKLIISLINFCRNLLKQNWWCVLYTKHNTLKFIHFLKEMVSLKYFSVIRNSWDKVKSGTVVKILIEQ